MPKIEKLTPAQEKQLPIFRQEYLNMACDGKRIDKPALQDAINQAYSVIGKSKPLLIVLQSPQQAMLAIKFMKTYAAEETGVSSELSSGISSGISSGVSSGISSGISSGVSSGISSELSSGISSGISSGVSSGVSSGISSELSSGISSGVSSGISSGGSSGGKIYLTQTFCVVRRTYTGYAAHDMPKALGLN